MNIRSALDLDRYVFRFFPQLPEDSFSVMQCNSRILIFIATRDGKMIKRRVYSKSWKKLNSSQTEFDAFTDEVLKAVEDAGYY